MKFKKAIIALLLLSSFAYVKSQDTIIFKNGTKMLAEILKIDTSRIKFKEIGIATKLVHNVDLSIVRRIEYGNGKVLSPQKVESDERHPAKIPDPEPIRVTKKFKKGVILTSLGGGCFITGASIGFWGFYELLSPKKYPDTGFEFIPAVIAGVALTAISIPCTIVGGALLRKYTKPRKILRQTTYMNFSSSFLPAVNTTGTVKFSAGMRIGLQF